MQLAFADYFEFAIAALFVLFYAWSRYNTPPSLIYGTTWGKFLAGRLGYVVLTLGLFFTLVYSPALLHWAFAGIESPLLESLHEFHRDISLPLLAALALTVLLSEIPVLRAVDEFLRERFHRMASIPHEQRRCERCLRRAELRSDDEMLALVQQRSAELEGLSPGDVRLKDDNSPQYWWTRASLLMDRLAALEGERKYAKELSSDAYKRLRERQRALGSKASACFKLARGHAEDEAVGLLRQEFIDQAQEFLDEIYRFVSGLILHCEATSALRRRSFETLGLEPPPARPERRVGAHEILWAFVLAMAFLIPTLGQLGAVRVLVIGFNVTVSVVVAVSVIGLRSHFFARARSDRRIPPIGRYGLSGLLAATVASLAMIVEEWVRSGLGLAALIAADSTPLDTFAASRWPWALMSFALAGVIAFLIDDWLTRRLPGWFRRTNVGGVVSPLDGLFAGLWMGLFAYTVVHPLVLNLDPDFGSSALTVASVACGLGFILGATIPALYRQPRRPADNLEEAAATPQPSG